MIDSFFAFTCLVCSAEDNQRIPLDLPKGLPFLIFHSNSFANGIFLDFGFDYS